jgi:hypothetical protein
VTVVPPLVELPPKKPPEKKPPPKPKPPDEPPTTIGTPLEPLLPTATGGGGGGAKTGGMIIRVVVAAPAAGAHSTRRTVRRTTRRCAVDRRACAVRAFACLTIAGRGGGLSARETALPPMIAPPQVQAQSFANAIRTDMFSILFLAGP